jgi:hypothetical protein
MHISNEDPRGRGRTGIEKWQIDKKEEFRQTKKKDGASRKQIVSSGCR